MSSPPPLSLPRVGVRTLVDGLKARRARTSDDRALAGRVRDAFEAPDAPHVHGLHLYVFDGAISVYGAVSTGGDRDAVMDALTGLPGATRIADHLTVLVG